MTNIANYNEFILILYTVGCSFAFISVLAVCLCGCRKGTPKNDLLGLHGMVKITNPDENVNHLPAVGNYMSQVAGDPFVSESDEHSKRPSGGSNPHRSLPDIPILAEGDVRVSENGVSGDTSSELYATVDDKTLSNLGHNKRHTLANGIENGPSLSHQSSVSQSDSNYARLKENPYDKVKKSENPYANLKSSDSKENDESSREPSPRSSRITWQTSSSTQSIDVVDQVPQERIRRSSAQSSHNANGTSVISDIPAATAVAGRVAASQELPYMTPPITQPQHFSGDSQDSSRGYTSISVREPLANIMNQTSSTRNRRNDLDPHYSTVSDDSDEMYAAIVEPNSNIYNGSETYAQIQPIVVAEIHNPAPNEDILEDDQYEPAPQPPSVDSLKHVAHVHSRQASSSSCTSSVANLGSPKPEKRQANSPLPPPPAISPDPYSRIDKNQITDENHLSVVRNLEDMYAKVHKNKKKSDSISSNEFDARTFVQSAADISTIPFQKLNQTDSSSSKKTWSSDECNNFDSSSIHSIDSDKRNQEHCYETLNKNEKKSPKKNTNTNQTNNCSGPESLLSNDPGYEQLNPHNRASSESDPNYEVLRPKRTSSVSDTSVGYSTIGNKIDPNYATVPESLSEPGPSCTLTDGYSVVNKTKKSKTEPGYEEVKNQNDEIIDEPNYESMLSECTDDNYASINQKSTESESDPNYESVKYLDVTLSEPPYERLHDDENNTRESSDLSEYEQISGNKGGEVPGYEKIKDHSENSEDRSDSSKISNNNEDESNNICASSNDQASIILTVNQDIAEVKINIPNIPKEIEGNDIFHV